MRNATSAPEIDAVVIDFRHIDREPRDGGNGSNIDSAELLLPLANYVLAAAGGRWTPTTLPGCPKVGRPFRSNRRHFSQNAPLTQSSNLHTSRAVLVAGSFKKPVPERPQRLAVKPSAAQALRVQASSFSVPVAAPAFQAMNTQLNALPILPVRARTVSGCLNSAFSRHFSTFYGSSVQAMDTQLDARHRRRTPTIHRGRAQRTISAGAPNPVGKKTRVNRNFAACQCEARPGRTARTMRCSRGRPVLTLSPRLSQLACKQMRFVVGVNRERLGAAFRSLELSHIADSSCGGDSRLRPEERAT